MAFSYFPDLSQPLTFCAESRIWKLEREFVIPLRYLKQDAEHDHRRHQQNRGHRGSNAEVALADLGVDLDRHRDGPEVINHQGRRELCNT